jgi:hypothetical protein
MERKVPSIWIIVCNLPNYDLYVRWRIDVDTEDDCVYTVVVRDNRNPVLLEIGEKCQSTLC